jgi:hypothetical protein
MLFGWIDSRHKQPRLRLRVKQFDRWLESCCLRG